MDWSSGVTFAGTLLSGGLLGQIITKVIERRDKRSDRRQARDELARSELRHAYANFVAAQTKYLNVMHNFLLLSRRFEDAHVEAKNNVPAYRNPRKQAEQENPDLVVRLRTQQDVAMNTQGEAMFRLAECIMLEYRPAWQGFLVGILEDPILSTLDSRYPEVLKRVRSHRERLSRLIKLLAGDFATDRWDNRHSRQVAADERITSEASTQTDDASAGRAEA